MGCGASGIKTMTIDMVEIKKINEEVLIETEDIKIKIVEVDPTPIQDEVLVLEEDVEALSDKLDVVEETCTTHKTATNTLDADTNTLDADTNNLKVDTASLVTSADILVTNSNTITGFNISGLETAIGALEDDVKSLQGNSSNCDENKLTMILDDITAMKNTFKSMEIAITNLPTATATHSVDTNTLDSEVDTLATNSNTLKTNSNTLVINSNTLKTNSNTLVTESATLVSQVDVMQADLATTKQDINDKQVIIDKLVLDYVSLREMVLRLMESQIKWITYSRDIFAHTLELMVRCKEEGTFADMTMSEVIEMKKSIDKFTGITAGFNITMDGISDGVDENEMIQLKDMIRRSTDGDENVLEELAELIEAEKVKEKLEEIKEKLEELKTTEASIEVLLEEALGYLENNAITNAKEKIAHALNKLEDCMIGPDDIDASVTPDSPYEEILEILDDLIEDIIILKNNPDANIDILPVKMNKTILEAVLTGKIIDNTDNITVVIVDEDILEDDMEEIREGIEEVNISVMNKLPKGVVIACKTKKCEK